MTKNNKLEIKLILRKFHKMMEMIGDESKNDDTERIIQLLGEWQTASIELGQTVETMEGTDTELVHVLEEFCEYLYQLVIAIQQGDFVYRKEERHLKHYVVQMENAVIQMATTYELVFMPYKASMWDSMESVYLAALEDPNCRAYVVPIPYLNANENGMKCNICYEGESFPENIPITSYRDFNLEEHQPDAIFIHNPFDDGNLVTSVFPEFYSENLKKYTEHLIYIPYYVTGGVVPEMHRLLPAHLHIDKMVIQSKQEAQYYTHKVLKGKLLPLGSPKFDKIIRYVKQKPKLPEEWKAQLENKKVFFYNTSLSGLLHDTDNAIRKMRYVFSCFNGRDDAAILWRPHPLTESTLQFLRPEVYDIYVELQREYLAQGIGVLDQTADVSKSVALSDAYIGESSSSVVQLLGATGRPVFLFDMGIFEELSDEEKAEPSMTNIVECKGKYWTFMRKFNALCNIDMDTGVLHIVTQIPGEVVSRMNLISSLYVDGETIVLSPDHLGSIVRYDVKKNSFSFWELEHPRSYANMGGFILYKNSYFIVPLLYPAFMQYIPEEDKYIYHKEIMEDIMQYGKEYEGVRDYCGGYWLQDNLLYITLCRTNRIVIWNLDTYKYEIVSIGAEEATYGAIIPVKTGLLICPIIGYEAVYWDLKKNTQTSIQLPSGEEIGDYQNPRGEMMPYSGFFYSKKRKLLLPQASKRILELDEDNLTFHETPYDITSYIEEIHNGIFDNRWGHIRATVEWDVEKILKFELTHLRLLFSDNGYLVDIDLDTGEQKAIKPHLDLEEVKQVVSIDKIFGRFSIDIPYAGFENPYVSLTDFIDGLVQNKLADNREEQLATYQNIAANLDGTCGEKIFEEIRKEILS